MTAVVETLIVGLVAYRLWRLVGQDDITEPVRNRHRIRHSTLVHALECGWCAGTWSALAVSFGAWAADWTETPPLLLGLAAAVVVGTISERLV